MHNEYIVSSIDNCYTKILYWLDSLPTYKRKYTSTDFSAETHAVPNLEQENYSNFVSSNNFTYSAFSSIPSKKIYPNDSIEMKYCVYINVLNEFYLIVCLDKIRERILFFTTDTYNFGYSCFDQEYNAYVKKLIAEKTTRFTDGSEENTFNIHNVSYIAVATLAIESEKTELHCNSHDNCVNISTIDASSYTRHTYNVFFGVIKQHRYYKGGHYYCGNACANVEVLDTFSVRRRYSTLGELRGYYAEFTYTETRINFIPDPTYADTGWHIRSGIYSTADVDINSSIVNSLASIYKLYFFNDFDFYLRIDVDSYPKKKMYWASNISNIIDDSLFICSHCSLTRADTDLPTYKNEISNSVIDPGRFINQFNGISLVMPIAVFVMREPKQLNEFSSVGILDYVSVVSMYNCSSGSINDVNYPIEENTLKYQCFSIYRRRMNTDFLDLYSWQKVREGFVGYNGLAVRQSEYVYPIVDWSLLADLREDNVYKDLTNENTGIEAYSGNVEFNIPYKSSIFRIDFTTGFLPLTVPYTYFKKIRIIYTDINCTDTYTYEISCIDLKDKIDSGTDFNLLGDNNSYRWIVGVNDAYPLKSVQLHTKESNCGIVDIFGI